ncbi:hypothetical protein CQW23_16201 [Capsicum baccatum]|uniref:Protein kinase domain-containing protein n=1 Tax=Capsicum baccatum TaxID=33114 RepID=A0A2G2WAB4_CAPBA|nr:hypothetical protein CQW23_16201 [Capsicum baccatum]
MALDPIVSSNSSARRWTDRISNALQKEVAIDFNLLPPICVLQVPKALSHKKPEAYTPQLIGMGPYHHLRPDLYQMERYKLAAIKDILKPDQILNLKNLLIDKLRENDLVVRACYNRFMDLDEETLAWIVAIDGLFLVNILCSAYGNNVHDEHENNIDDTIFTQDFMMLENQIPFVVMKQIRKFLRLSSPQDREDTELISMFRRFCEMHSPLPLPAKSEYHRNNGKETRPLHLLDLMYHLILDDRVDFASVPIQMSSIVIKHGDKDEEHVQDQDTLENIIHNFETILEVLEPIGPRNLQKLVKPINQVVEKVPWSTISGLFREAVEIHGDGESKNISTIPSASRLWCYAGVRCIPIHEGISRIKFEQASRTLYLPVITMNTGAEVLLRNLMVYEAAMSKSKLEFARYINLMSGVADAIKDVKLLRKAGVIKGDLTDNEIATLFSTMQRSFVRSNGSSNVAIAMEEVNNVISPSPSMNNSASIQPFSGLFFFLGSLVILIILLLLILVLLKLFKPGKLRALISLIAKRPPGTSEALSVHLRTISYFNFHTLEKATKNFHSDNLLGCGGFGPVFLGKLGDGKLIAVKKLSLDKSQQGDREFLAEMRLITSIQHKNLVRLLGCCSDGAQRLLVYEYMKNRSLDQILFGKSDIFLNWKTRYQIILGIARGLQYLHEDSHIRIVHRDIKASNILLDDKFQPRIGDFGLARFFPEDQAYLSTAFAGTLGYTAPEYALRGELTEKADIYSFGVLVLEIINCRKNTDLSLPSEMQYLPEYVRCLHFIFRYVITMKQEKRLSVYHLLTILIVQVQAWKLYERSRLVDLVDPKMKEDGIVEKDVMQTIHVAFLCLQRDANLRPPMSEIVAMLVHKAALVETSTRPAFLDRKQRKDVKISWDTTIHGLPSPLQNDSPSLSPPQK